MGLPLVRVTWGDHQRFVGHVVRGTCGDPQKGLACGAGYPGRPSKVYLACGTGALFRALSFSKFAITICIHLNDAIHLHYYGPTTCGPSARNLSAFIALISHMPLRNCWQNCLHIVGFASVFTGRRRARICPTPWGSTSLGSAPAVAHGLGAAMCCVEA